MRVYGALMWSLGKVLTCPEVPRVYLGSWWAGQLRHDQLRSLFQLEEQDLFNDLRALPRGASLRKLNDLIKRARLARWLPNRKEKRKRMAAAKANSTAGEASR